MYTVHNPWLYSKVGHPCPWWTILCQSWFLSYFSVPRSVIGTPINAWHTYHALFLDGSSRIWGANARITRCISHPWLALCSSFLREKLLYSPNEKLVSLASSFGYVAPKVIKNTGHENPVDIWLMGMIVSTRIHKQNTSSCLSLCILVITYVLPCGYAPFSCRHSWLLWSDYFLYNLESGTVDTWSLLTGLLMVRCDAGSNALPCKNRLEFPSWTRHYHDTNWEYD